MSPPAAGAGGATSPVEQALEKARAFAERLLSENARLRKALAGSHAGGRPLAPVPARGPFAEDTGPIHLAAGESDAAVRRVRQLEAEVTAQRRRGAELEEQNNSLANLYVATYQLHSTLDFKEVMAIVIEIVVNLIGAESCSVMLVDGRTNELLTVATEGLSRQPTTRLKVGDGALGKVAKSGQPHYLDAAQGGGSDLLHPLAAIPLKIQEHVIGVIAVHALLPQKSGFSQVDYDLFNLLAGHAATAIFSAKLYGEAERKLTTIQSFLDLLTTT